MGALVTADQVIADLGLKVAPSDPKLAQCVAATVAYVSRYHEAPAGDADWPDDYRLGAIRLAAGLYRNANSPGVSEAFGIGSDQAFRRATDVQTEQLLRIGRFAPPMVG